MFDSQACMLQVISYNQSGNLHIDRVISSPSMNSNPCQRDFQQTKIETGTRLRCSQMLCQMTAVAGQTATWQLYNMLNTRAGTKAQQG